MAAPIVLLFNYCFNASSPNSEKNFDRQEVRDTGQSMITKLQLSILCMVLACIFSHQQYGIDQVLSACMLVSMLAYVEYGPPLRLHNIQIAPQTNKPILDSSLQPQWGKKTPHPVPQIIKCWQDNQPLQPGMAPYSHYGGTP